MSWLKEQRDVEKRGIMESHRVSVERQSPLQKKEEGRCICTWKWSQFSSIFWIFLLLPSKGKWKKCTSSPLVNTSWCKSLQLNRSRCYLGCRKRGYDVRGVWGLTVPAATISKLEIFFLFFLLLLWDDDRCKWAQKCETWKWISVSCICTEKTKNRNLHISFLQPTSGKIN